jgi:poly-gamma-glutamate capsule biosynthesis protein CapA/YwtB (metallophosphatase superfamily)
VTCQSNQSKDVLTLLAVGDVSPNREDPPSIFRSCGDVFRKADIVFGQMEAPLSDRGTPMFVPSRPRRVGAKNISALTEEGGGFHVMSHACNHAMDYGWEAFFDTLDALKKSNIAVVGAGRNIEEARRPAILERKGTKVGFLAYLSILPLGLIAEEKIPGCAPLRASDFYYHPFSYYQPGLPPLIITNLFPADRQAMEDDIRRLRPQVDVLVVSMHCGVQHTPAMIAMYQKEAGYAAIDAGADLVLQHHAHILKGIEVYKGKVVFYGLGDFACEHALGTPGMLEAWDHAHRTKNREFFGIKLQPGQKRAHHPDALRTMIAKVSIEDGKIVKVTYIPAYINSDLEPEVVTRQDPRGQEVFDYVRQISESEDLKVNFSWEGDEILVS